MAKSTQKKDVGKMSFEETIGELTGIVGAIEDGQIPLEESIGQYERGMVLIKHCREILARAEERIEKISRDKKTEDRRQFSV